MFIITHQKIVFLAVTLTSLFVNVQGEAILHVFNWSYDEINTRAADIAAAGYAAVLVAPAYKSWGIEWWERYQPLDYRVSLFYCHCVLSLLIDVPSIATKSP